MPTAWPLVHQSSSHFIRPVSRGTCLTPKKALSAHLKCLVPLPVSLFHCALAIESGQVVHYWISTAHEPTLHPTRNRLPVGAPTAEVTETYLNTHADILFFLAHAVRARGSDGHQNVLWFSDSNTAKQSKKGNTIKCSKQGFAQIAQTSLLTTQGCTFLKQKQRIRRMTVSFGNKAVK